MKYILNVPAVVGPNEVASKRRMSVGANVTLPTVTEVPNASKIESASKRWNAKVSAVTPTSDPSKNRLQAEPSNFMMSSSAKETPPTLPLLANEA